MAKKDAWLLRTQQALHKAGVIKALEHGRPTVATVRALHPKLGVRGLQSMVEQLMPHYEEQIGIAFDVLVARLDLSDHWLCNEVNRYVHARDGQAVWDLIQRECDVSTGAKQDAVVSKWETFSVPADITPDRLRTALSARIFTDTGKSPSGGGRL